MVRPLLVLSLLAAPALAAEDTPEVKALKARVADLEDKLRKAEAEVAALRAKLPEAPADDGKERRTPLAGRLTKGAVVKGQYRSPAGQASGGLTLTVTDRDGGKFKADLRVEPKDKPAKTGHIEGTLSHDTIRFTGAGLTKVGGVGSLKGDRLEVPVTFSDGRKVTFLFEVK